MFSPRALPSSYYLFQWIYFGLSSSLLSWIKSSLPGAVFALKVSSLYHRENRKLQFPESLASRVLIGCHQCNKVTQDLQCNETTSHEAFSAVAGRCMAFVRALCICLWASYCNAEVCFDHCWQCLAWSSSNFPSLCGLSVNVAVAFPDQFSNPYNDCLSI